MKDRAPEYLTPAQVIERWDGAVTMQTLANWRSKRKGPPFQKFGTRVRYPLASLAAWEAANLHTTGQASNDNTDTTTKESAA